MTPPGRGGQQNPQPCAASDGRPDLLAGRRPRARPVRGVHPAVLTDRGLDAALSALVAHSPIPVDVDIRLCERPPTPVETTAYFVIAEALTNVAKHSNATHAEVSVRNEAGTVIVQVTDDGSGGAHPARVEAWPGCRNSSRRSTGG